ncbi:unnamed protein product [Cyprideis torosa]|uniref:Uncharacterized protein n=1 Tax=Cyprideis torosa TaxID=163714 RepID=A0A7R8WNP0_9CRUS|nr:unnamed protein product [Cyprideis torosa]CAG0900650.1 unnamed protein product [Cyprideis torosa]
MIQFRIARPAAAAFYEASRDGDLSSLRRLSMETEKELLTVPEPVKGKTALMEAAAEGHYHAALWLLREFGADLNAEDFESRAPLHYACEAGRPLIVSLLLREGALVEARNNDGQTPMFDAAVKGRPTTLRLLHRFGANEAATDTDDWTPLHFATDRGHTSSVACLLEMGAPMEAADKDKRRPLHLACDKGHFPCARLLVNAGADVNARTADGETPFLIAAGLNHVEILRLLAHSGADISLADECCSKIETEAHCMNKSDSLFFLPHTDDRMTPLHFAADDGHTSSVACLLEMGAPVEAAEKKRKARPLHLACISGHTPCVDLLLNAGADINARTRSGLTPLHLCSMEGHRAVVLLLLGRGADVDCRDEGGMTPLLRACFEGHVSVARDLVSNGADVNDKERAGMTPLIRASEGGHVETVEFLVRETEADLEGKGDIGGWTALALAAGKGHTQVMKILLAAGAEVDARGSDGGTPLKWACMRRADDYGVNAVWDALESGDPSLREYFMSLCGMEYVLEVSQVEKKRHTH